MAGIPTSIRLPPGLGERLERTARRLLRGKSCVIARALEEYLAREEREALRSEARRQSRVASAAAWPDEPRWEADASDCGWCA